MISKSFGERVLFENVNLGISRGEKIALIGRNGSGKTALLRILAQTDEPDSGEIQLRKGTQMAFLIQDPVITGDLTAKEYLLSQPYKELDLLNQYNELVQSNNKGPDINKIQAEIDILHAWSFESKIEEALHKLGLGAGELSLSNLSGGQQKRLALASVILTNPDLLILDEPTNHMDLEGVEWLEKELSKEKMTLMMVSHDRYFLDRVCNSIIELEDESLYEYQGNYSYFIEKKAMREEISERTSSKARSLMRKELEWMRRQPKARSTKSKARIDSFYDLKEQARYRYKEPTVDFKTKASRLGGKVVELLYISFGYENLPILKDYHYAFRRGEKLGIVGNNGVGKSTFLKLIVGDLKPQAGKVVHGDTLRLAHYKQEGIDFKPAQKVIEYIRDIAEVIDTGKNKVSASQLLNHFNFDFKKQHDFVDKLSGGEKRRLYLTGLLISNPNLLILDEPTNDLDIFTIQALEEYLSSFKGCLIIVSHDRFFMDKVVDHLFVFKGEGKVLDFPGNYTQYREEYIETENKIETNIEEAAINLYSEQKKERNKNKLSYKEQEEFKEIEKELPRLEKEKEILISSMNSNELDHKELHEAGSKLNNIDAAIEEKEMRWLELSEGLDN